MRINNTKWYTSRKIGWKIRWLYDWSYIVLSSDNIYSNRVRLLTCLIEKNTKIILYSVLQLSRNVTEQASTDSLCCNLVEKIIKKSVQIYIYCYKNISTNSNKLSNKLFVISRLYNIILTRSISLHDKLKKCYKSRQIISTNLRIELSRWTRSQTNVEPDGCRRLVNR